MKMKINEAKKILKEARISVKPAKKLAADDLNGFFEDLNAALERAGFDEVEDFDEFEEELNDMGCAHLFNLADDEEYDAWEEEHDGDEGYADHYFKLADKYIKKITRTLAAKWSGFSLDYDEDDTMIFVLLYVDGIGDEE